MKIEFANPDITSHEIEGVIEVLNSGWITTGEKTKLFESQIAKYIGNKKAVCLNSATAAMELTLSILGVGPGDEVITTAYTYTASASIIHHRGAKIVLIDTKENSFEMDDVKLEEAITEKTKVIIPVDLGGRMCDYPKILDIVNAKKHLFTSSDNIIQQAFGRIIVLADAAHAFGAKQYYGDTWYNCGQMADFTSFSFHAVKNLTTAEGGAVTWKPIDGIDDEWIYKQYMLYSLHGQNKDALSKQQASSWEYDIIFPGYKCNMTDIMAAIGIKQLERYEHILSIRKSIIEKYDNFFLSMGMSSLTHYDEANVSSGHLYLLRVPYIKEDMRNKIIIKAAEEGITLNVHYKPLPMMTAYINLGFDIKDYQNAYNQYSNEISFPLYTSLTEEQINYICDKMKAILKEVNVL